MAPAAGKKAEDKGPGEIVNELWILCRDYAKQETVDPLKQLLQFVKWGFGGALLLALGLVFGAVSVLRILQNETGEHLTGSWSWVPYLAALVFTAAAIALSVAAITRPVRGEEKQA